MRSAIAGLRRTSVIGRDADGAWAIRRPVAEGFDCQVLAADPTLHPGRPTLPAWRNGRRDRLKICCPEGCGGSSPSAGTTFKKPREIAVFSFPGPLPGRRHLRGRRCPQTRGPIKSGLQTRPKRRQARHDPATGAPASISPTHKKPCSRSAKRIPFGRIST